ncbi:MAG TPA: DUF2975 domain-containing protein [Propionibacteriaceae bacterium]
MRRGLSFALTAVLLGLLLLSLLTQMWALPTAVERTVALFPEVESIAVPAIVWGVIAIACWQAIAVICLRILMLARERRFGDSADGWLYAIVGCLLAFIVLVAAALIALTVMEYDTPGVMLGLLGGGLIAFIAVCSLGISLATRR